MLNFFFFLPSYLVVDIDIGAMQASWLVLSQGWLGREAMWGLHPFAYHNQLREARISGEACPGTKQLWLFLSVTGASAGAAT